MSMSRSRSRGIGRPAGAVPLSRLTAVSAISPRATSSVTSDTDRSLSVHVFGSGTDAVDHVAQGVDVDPVQRRRGQAEDLARLFLRDVPEAFGDPVAGVRVRALGVGKIVAPEEILNADLVATLDLVDAGCRRREEAVAVHVLAGLHGQAVLEDVAELAGVVAAEPLLVHALDDVGHPPRPVLGDRVAQGGVALEDTGEDQHPERPGRPPPRLG